MFNLKSVIFIASICFVFCSTIREKRQTLTYTLPDSAEKIANIEITNFRCPSDQFGYFADTEADCKLFHVCLPQDHSDGKRTISQYSFVCGNQTVFNQFSLTCTHPDESVPCASSPDFFYLNERVGQKVNFHSDDDLVKLSALLSKN